MTARINLVTAVTLAPAGYVVRVLRLDDDGAVSAESHPVAALAAVASCAVDGGPLDREIVAAILDPIDGAVVPFGDLVAPGWSAARLILPGDPEDGHDETLAQQLTDEQAARARISGVPS